MGKRAPKLCVVRGTSTCIPGRRGRETGDREALATVTEQLRVANDELVTLRAQSRFKPPVIEECAGEDDLRQSRALYNLLTEVWIFTDSAVRGMKVQFDRLLALMEVRVAERDLRIAKLEAALDTVSRNNEGGRVTELEAELRDTRAKLTAVEGDLRETRTIVKEETERMKDEHKKRMAHLTEQCSDTVGRLRAELVAKDSELHQSCAHWEAEKRDLVDQLTELKELRKPLANPPKRK